MEQAAVEPSQANVETPQNSAEPALEPPTAQQLPAKRWGIPFTKENSAEMARRAQAAAKERKEREAQEQAKSAELWRADTAHYLKERLVRVRKQLEKLDTLMDAELDPQKLDRLASAQARLSEQERLLSGRPLPGSHRPSKQSTPKPSTIEPSE